MIYINDNQKDKKSEAIVLGPLLENLLIQCKYIFMKRLIIIASISSLPIHNMNCVKLLNIVKCEVFKVKM